MASREAEFVYSGLSLCLSVDCDYACAMEDVTGL